MPAHFDHPDDEHGLFCRRLRQAQSSRDEGQFRNGRVEKAVPRAESAIFGLHPVLGQKNALKRTLRI